jgi:hypothetical protein
LFVISGDNESGRVDDTNSVSVPILLKKDASHHSSSASHPENTVVQSSHTSTSARDTQFVGVPLQESLPSFQITFSKPVPVASFEENTAMDESTIDEPIPGLTYLSEFNYPKNHYFRYIG